MLKLLLRLWWLRKRRCLKKRDIAVAIYLLFVYIAVCVGFYYGVKSSGETVESVDSPAVVGIIVAITMLVPDIIMKTSMKQDATFMDDYLKTKPVPERLWSRFIVVSNVVNFWNYLIPVMMVVPFLMFQTAAQTVACFVIMVLLSYADSLFVISFRRTKDKFLRFSIIAGWFVMLFESSLFTGLFFWANAFVLDAGMLLLAIAVIAGLAAFVSNEENYDESTHKVARQHSLGRVTLFTMQFYGLLRAKRLRNMVLFITLLFIFDTYLFAWSDDVGGDQGQVYAVLAVIMPSLVLSQWTFGVEANFFQGLMTKPVSVDKLLANCYYFYIILSFASALLMVPLMFLYEGFTPQMLVASFFSAVFLNLFNLPTCLFSTRLEIFGGAFFNMQGSNMKINFFAIALLVPIGVLGCVWYFLGVTAFEVAGIALGVASLAVHRKVIGIISRVFENRKYARLEAFKE